MPDNLLRMAIPIVFCHTVYFCLYNKFYKLVGGRPVTDELQVQIRESCLFHFATEIIHSLLHTVCITETFQQFMKTKYGKYRTIVYLVIVGLVKVLAYHSFYNDFKVGPVYHTGPQTRVVVLVTVYIPIVVCHVMVGPHQVKLHFFIILGFQKSIVYGAF